MKIKALIILALTAAAVSCSRPTQIRPGNGGKNISFLGFNGNTTLEAAVNQISEWLLYFEKEEKDSYATITCEQILYENVEYSQIMFYFNSEKKLYKIRCHISSGMDINKVTSRLKFQYEQVREKGQKSNELIFRGKDGSKALFTLHNSENYGTLQITFNN